MLEPAETALVDAVAGRFTVHERLGEGGAGVVYRAFDRTRRHDVALKRLRLGQGNELYRFKQEFRALSGIVHPNLVTLYELHSADHAWFFTMELIDGVDWLEHVRPFHGLVSQMTPTPSDDEPELTLPTGAMPRRAPASVARREALIRAQLREDRLREVVAQTVEGVLHLHRRGKLHCDLKPPNVLVDRSGRAVVCDFGLVTEASADRSEWLAGTPSYMSPEQVSGGALTPATDWYSLGVMMFEALTGRRPFEGAPSAVMDDKRARSAARVADIVPDSPSDLAELTDRLLVRDPEQRPDSDELLRAVGSGRHRAAVVTPSRVHAPFAGRRPQLARLEAALADVAGGGGCTTVFVSGRSGMGKSALVREFVARARAQQPVFALEGQCHERESMPYKALDGVVDAIGRELVALPSREVERLIPDNVAALARLFPTLVRVPEIRRAGAGELVYDYQERRSRAFVALRHVLHGLAELRPTIVTIDDMQWGDMDSASLIADLIHDPQAPPILLVVAFRSDEASSNPVLLAMNDTGALGNGPAPRNVEVGPLTDEEARELAGVLLGASEREDSGLLTAITREANGNPFLMSELCRRGRIAPALSPDVANVDQLLAERMARLPADACAVLTVAAIAARPVPVGMAGRLAKTQDEARTLALLEAEHLIRFRHDGEERRLELYHDRVRETITAGLPGKETRRLHRRLARAFEAYDRRDAEALAEHWLAAGEPERAISYSMVAARQAETALAFHRAARHYQRALEISSPDPAERRRLLWRIGDLLAAAGSLEESSSAYLEATHGADDADALELRRLAMEQLMRAGKFVEGIALCRDVLAAIGVAMPSSDRAKLAMVAWHRLKLALRGLHFRAKPEADRDAELLRKVDILWSISSGLSFVDPLLGTSFQAQQLRAALDAGDPYRASIALTLEVGFRSTAGARARAKIERAVGPASRLAEDSGSSGAEGFAIAITGLSAFLMGEFGRAHEALTRGERLLVLEATRFRWQLDVTKIFEMAALLYLGRIGELTTLVPRVLRDALGRGDAYLALATRGWRSNFAWLAMGDPDQARQQADAVVRVEQAGDHFHLQHYYELLALTHIDVYAGAPETAWQRLQQYDGRLTRSMLRRIQSVRIESRFLRGRTALSSATEQRLRPDRVADARRCVKALRKERARWADALAALLWASADAVAGQTQEAVDGFATAEDLCRATRMELFAQIARHRRGHLLGGDSGLALVESAAEWMRRESIRDPARIAALFAPL